jgi:hypothetical protein
MPLVVWK